MEGTLRVIELECPALAKYLARVKEVELAAIVMAALKCLPDEIVHDSVLGAYWKALVDNVALPGSIEQLKNHSDRFDEEYFNRRDEGDDPELWDLLFRKANAARGMAMLAEGPITDNGVDIICELSYACTSQRDYYADLGRHLGLGDL